MPNCTLTIATTVDGKETQTSPKGAFIDYGDKIAVDYCDGVSATQVVVQGSEATIVRKGDYGTVLSLIKGQKTQGVLDISGSVGKMDIYTHRVEYSKKGNTYLITLGYDIIFGGEAQKMQVRIFVRNNG